MSDVAIRVEGLGKRYQLNRAQPRARYQTLQSDLLALPRTLWSRATGRRAPKEEFWALRDVSFEVCQGEALGIIGRNCSRG
jgi:ABC-type polysaccharide/polyol phosphate transport system ATPase subunit